MWKLIQQKNEMNDFKPLLHRLSNFYYKLDILDDCIGKLPIASFHAKTMFLELRFLEVRLECKKVPLMP